MALLPRPVTKISSSMPAARASSTAYWISGLSTTGSISFGIALVAGRKRVPRPPTGKMALRNGLGIWGDPRWEDAPDWCHNRTRPSTLSRLAGSRQVQRADEVANLLPRGDMRHGELDAAIDAGKIEQGQ